MFDKLKDQIDNIKAERSYIDAEWDTAKDKALLSFYIKIMPKMLDAERCSIFIHDPSTRKVWLKCGTGLSEKQIQVPVGQDSVVSQVIATGKYQMHTGLENKPGIHKKFDEETNFVTRDILCIPIKTLDGKGVAGAIQVLNKTNQNPFNEDDRKLLEEMAHYLELTIESIYMGQKTAGVLDAVFGLMGKFALFAIAVVILITVILSIYWLGFYFMG